MMVDKLTSLIVNELGQRVITNLPDMFARGWNIPQCASLEEEVRKMVSTKNCWAVQELLNKIEEQRAEYNGRYRTSIAARIPGHDLCNIWMTVQNSVEGFEYGESEYAAEQVLKDITPYRAFCLTVSYLASEGDNKFSSQIPVVQIQRFLQGLSKYRFEFVSGRNDNELILTPEYIALLQIVKNAPKIPRVSYSKIDDYAIITVQDSGKGIRDKDKSPLAPDRLGEIFGIFTTKDEGGLGLQVAKELVHLRGGYLVVETTTEGSPTFSFSTKTNTVKEVQPKNRGTTFEVYVPLVR